MATRSMAARPSWIKVGLVTFAGVMMIAIGVFQMLEGIAAVSEGEFYVVTANYAYKIDVSRLGMDSPWLRDRTRSGGGTRV